MEESGKLPQLVGGVSPEASAGHPKSSACCGETIEMSPIEAELGKLFANAYRYINFAISNQFYRLREVWRGLPSCSRGGSKDYPRMAGFAGAGFAGGPCLLKDTMQLAAFKHDEFVLGQAAMMVNEGFPRAGGSQGEP